MNLLEINLENPIDDSEVIYLKSRLISVEKHNFLVINIGQGNFLSEDVFKNYIDQLTDIEPCFVKFKKVAFIHPSLIIGMNFTIEGIKFFISRDEAIHWFLNDSA
jgi:hypothetical protein